MAADPLRVVEAAYRFDCDDQAWLSSVTEEWLPQVAEARGDGLLGMLVDRRTREVKTVAADHAAPEAFAALQALVDTGFQPEVADRLRAAGPASTLSCALGPIFRDRFEKPLRDFGIADVLFVFSGDPYSTHCVLSSPLRTRERIGSEARTAWARMAAHMTAASRLRSKGPSREDGEAVLSPDGKVQHAEGEARSRASRAALQSAARAMVAANELRTTKPRAALALWQALVHGRWTLVERFDRDQKRFLIARRNTPDVVPAHRLTPHETRVATLAALGHSNKIIAYELGIPESSVAGTLARAMRRLGLSSRVELARLFASTLP